jgi:DNA-directed RNA polymerase subunit RPC12/RpoP
MLNELFFKLFPDEQSCKIHFKTKREQKGIVCKNCGGLNHFWMENQEKWQCKECKSRTNLTGGTLMHRSKMDLFTRYKCMHYMSNTKTITFSALQMMRNLGKTKHKSVWEMMHKIRISMGNRDSEYKLQGDMEIDDAFFECVMHTKSTDNLGNETLIDKYGEPIVCEETKRGRGT